MKVMRCRSSGAWQDSLRTPSSGWGMAMAVVSAGAENHLEGGKASYHRHGRNTALKPELPLAYELTSLQMAEPPGGTWGYSCCHLGSLPPGLPPALGSPPTRLLCCCSDCSLTPSPCEATARHFPKSLEIAWVPDMESCEWQTPHESMKMGKSSALSRKSLGRKPHWCLGK